MQYDILTCRIILAFLSWAFLARALAVVPNTIPPLTKTVEHLPLANAAMRYVDNSPDPFHAVQTSTELLQQAGFVELTDGVPYKGMIQPGGKYYYTRNKSTLVAFAIGARYKSGHGFKIIGGHTDSPNLRVKPRSKRSGSGCIQIGVECYGGGLWHTWFDRDLGIAGRVLVRRDQQEEASSPDTSNSRIVQRLVRIDRPILRISNLAIHLQTAKEREGFVVNKEDHLSPILALEATKALTVGESTNTITACQATFSREGAFRVT